MSINNSHGKELLHIFYYMQQGLPLFEINYKMKRDCTRDINQLKLSNEKVRRKVLSVNSYEYHRMALNATAFTQLDTMSVDNWSPFRAALAYMYTCAAVDDKCITFCTAVPKMIEQSLGKIANGVLQKNNSSVFLSTTYMYGSSFDEFEFIQALNGRNVSDNEYTVLLASVLNAKADTALLHSYVSDRALDRICKILTGLKNYNEVTVTTVYMLALLMIANPEKEPKELYHTYMNATGFPPYLEQFGWNPRNIKILS